MRTLHGPLISSHTVLAPQEEHTHFLDALFKILLTTQLFS